ncbi:FMN-dependent NADH-azoreductase [Pandoraea anhela]|uniref:FMN dependent NADH:quinone oxidoreductase n=1 Tax=Pandoraea anhela TaxID=2508295 RepID=A0A5E4ZBW6_9BURK|nr:NAD(P)H-dependent oxidoreductase [Pandoraea anhela]VVE57663.1 FMN-dependent NADH-azoreductase [Pandoraea anhela]
MPTLLHIESSPRKKRSASIEVATSYMDAWRNAGPDRHVEVLDLWAAELPQLDGDALEAKYADLEGASLNDAQKRAWDVFRQISQRLHNADVLMFSVPMWNFSVPYKLKHFIDVVSHRGLLFSYDERGLTGLLTGKKAVVVYAKGLRYATDAATPAGMPDFQQPFLDAWLRFIGVTDIESIVVEKTLLGAQTDRIGRQAACERAAAMAARELERPC